MTHRPGIHHAPTTLQLPFRWVREDRPGPQWASLAMQYLPAYLRWYAGEGAHHRPALATCRRELARHMPELVSTWERLVELVGGDPVAARLLSLWEPPAYFAGCSQAAWTRGAPVLVRNYDYYPKMIEGTFLSSAWTGTRVLASSDCLWGALDGMNEHGLSVALAYGGRTPRGPGFGIPLIVRYLLETCRSTQGAIEVLHRVPSHMAYNVLLLDARSSFAVVQVGPDQKSRVLRTAVATNHQRVLRWPLDGRAAGSLIREQVLEKLLVSPEVSVDMFRDAFLSAPLYSTDFAGGNGTLYTVSYHPTEGKADYRWPGIDVTQRLEAFQERSLVVTVS